MRIRRSLIGCLLAGVVAVGATGCAQPQPNPDVRFSGDPAEAIPSSEPEETTTTAAPTTTLFFGPDAGSDAPADG